MQHLRYNIVGAMLLVCLCVPQTGLANTSDAQYIQQLRQLVVLLQQRLAALQAAQQHAPGVLVPRATYDGDTQSISRIANQPTRHFFTRLHELLPRQYNPLLQTVAVADLGAFDGYVSGSYSSQTGVRWQFLVDQSFLQEGPSDESVDELIVHEIAHIIAETPNLTYFGTRSCHEHFRATGCLDVRTIYGAYVDRFWNDTKLNAATRIRSGQLPTDWLFKRYPNTFVSEYAANSPAEDFAESFTYYVLYPDTFDTGLVADKVQFFATVAEAEQVRQLGGW